MAPLLLLVIETRTLAPPEMTHVLLASRSQCESVSDGPHKNDDALQVGGQSRGAWTSTASHSCVSSRQISREVLTQFSAALL